MSSKKLPTFPKATAVPKRNGYSKGDLLNFQPIFTTPQTIDVSLDIYLIYPPVINKNKFTAAVSRISDIPIAKPKPAVIIILVIILSLKNYKYQKLKDAICQVQLSVNLG